jgi:tetratricopeptide (TPR) repeat protein
MLTIETARLTIPTYHRGPDAPFAPLSFSGRAHRGRTAFPYHAQDDIDIASMRRDDGCEHTVVRLSNGLLEALVLPGLDGRLYSLRDLRTGRELFYRNRVVKPALVALRGAWLSGGIEFNFPTVGHTVSTVSPVFCRTEQTPGEVAVIVGDVDRSTRQRWQVRMALRQGRAALDVDLLFANPNHHRERLYYWENAAVPATDDLRFVCRCDWTVGSTSLPFPLRDGVDRSLHVNNPTPLDHFGYRSHADFFGAYYLNRRQGTYHVAPRFALPGQKYFTWGIQEDNRIWEHYLTDNDGQYVEIQAGVLESQWFSDWLQPQETLRAGGSWFGTEDMGEITWASPRLAVAASADGSGLGLDVYSIDVEGDLRLTLANAAGTNTRQVAVAPGTIGRTRFPEAAAGLLEVHDHQGHLLLRQRWFGSEADSLDPHRDRTPPVQWTMRARHQSEVGKAAVAVQYHRWHEARTLLDQALPAEHALERALLRAELSLGTHRPADALQTARQALETFAGEPRLHAIAAAGALRLLQQSGDPVHYSGAWDHLLAARRDPGLAPAMLRLLAEAEIAAGHLPDAARLLAGVLEARPDAVDARALLAAVHRHCGDATAARAVLAAAPATAFGLYGAIEGALQGDPATAALDLPELPPDRPWAPVYRAELLVEAALLYWRAGLRDDVVGLLDRFAPQCPALAAHPLAALLRMDAAAAAGNEAQARFWATRAAACPVDWVVPSTWEAGVLLDRALTRLPEAGQGCLPYLQAILKAETDDVEAAIALFARAATADEPSLRALAAKALADWAAAGSDRKAEAVAHLESALAAWPTDRRLLLYLDDCLRALHDTERRNRLWTKVPSDLRDRGDVTFARARLEVDSGRYEPAIEALLGTEFSVFEGGTAVRRLYVDALLAAAVDAFLAGQTDSARRRCQQVFEYPENLGAAGYLGEHSRLARYLLGLFAERAGKHDEAVTWWQDVLSRAGGVTTYTVGGEGANTLGRLDEHLALLLADKRLKGTVHADPRPGEGLPEAADQAARRLCEALAAGSPQTAGLAAEALRRFPCDPLVRILTQVARVE